jgi:hypothetical protein
VDIYVINLDDETQRWSSSQKELTKMKLTALRFSAVCKDKISITEPSLVTNGVKACWESHRGVFQEFLSSNQEYALVLEDDFSLQKLRSIRALLSKEEYRGFDVIQIGFITPGIHRKFDQLYKNLEALVFWIVARSASIMLNEKTHLQKRLRIRIAMQTPFGWVPDDFLPGTHSYIISRKAAELALELNQPQFLSADDFFTAWAKMRSVRFIRTMLSFTKQKKFKAFSGPRFINS